MASVSEVHKQIASEIKWKIDEQRSDDNQWSCVSNPENQTHTIKIPSDKKLFDERTYLHEYLHAWLAEKVHHLMGSIIFKDGTSENNSAPMHVPILVAQDWFVDGALMDLCPKEQSAAIIHSVDDVLRHLEELRNQRDDYGTYRAGLLVAQTLYWKLKDVETPEILSAIVAALLKFSPEILTMGRMEALSNELSAITTIHKIRLILDEDLEVWEVI